MASMKTYLALVPANTSATASVYFDTVESTTNATGVETTGETTGQNILFILALTAGGTPAKGKLLLKEIYSWCFCRWYLGMVKGGKFISIGR